VPVELQKQLPRLLPAAIRWSEAQSRAACTTGTALSEPLLSLATRVGVRAPAAIRIAHTDKMPLPDDPALAEAALQAGLLGPEMIGLTLGYAVFIRRGHLSARLLAHEFRHVEQFERHGSLAAFLSEYLGQFVEYGYRDAPYEQDARAHERAAKAVRVRPEALLP
jgi:hypothetical protein